MQALMIKWLIGYTIFLYSMAYAVSAYSANNSIYITQSGGSSALTMNLDQIGSSNVIGTTSARVSLTGTSMTVDVDQVGDSNVIAATGDSNVLVFTQGAAATATSGNTDIVIAGTSNNLNLVSEVVGGTNNWDVDGDSNDIDTTQTGNANHSVTADITGNTNNIDIDQTNSGGSTSGIVDLVAITTGGVIDIDQCTSGC